MTHACAVPYTQDTAQKRAPQFGGLPGACRADRYEDAGTDEVRYVVVEGNQLLLLRSPLGISRPRSGPTKVGTDHGQGDTQGRCHAGQRHRRSFGPLGRKLVPRCRWWRWTRPGPNAPDMPFSCVLYEPVPQYDTCMYLKVDMGENSSAGACDTIVIILPSRRVCEPAETKKKRE